MNYHQYKKRWITTEGAAFRAQLFERQRKGGSNPLTDNPSIEEIKSAIRKFQPRRVLEVGCGWGRILEGLVDEFDAYGCDISADLLQRADPALRAKLLTIDIAAYDPELAPMYKGVFDVVFSRGVMQEFIDEPELTLQALNNLNMLANQKVILWEQQEVCDALKSQIVCVAPNPKPISLGGETLFEEYDVSSRFELFPIKLRTE